MAFVLFILMFTLTLVARGEATQEIRTNESLWSSDNSAHPEELTLACNLSSSHHGLVYWKKDLKWAGNGRTLKIRVRETPDAGNYTCWSNTTHKLLSYSVVYITKRSTKGEIEESVLKCSETVPQQRTCFYCAANNYSGNFTCFWETHSQNSELKFNIGAESGNQMKSAPGTVICENPQNNPEGPNPKLYSASCRIENPCSFTEEYQPVVLFLDIFNKFVYEKHTTSFFIKDILKPDISQCQVTKNGILTWSPPPTWSTPVTYFGLTYQIQVVANNNYVKICEVDHSLLLQHGDTMSCIYKLCRFGECSIRSRDYYHRHSAWSEWSECRESGGSLQVLHKGKYEVKVNDAGKAIQLACPPLRLPQSLTWLWSLKAQGAGKDECSKFPVPPKGLPSMCMLELELLCGSDGLSYPN
ncbi:interleukin-12 subunit beta [Candoia aspera]|uniref:interleukin-12 subunit beta n=1 Tax=Candoia aspera TaxID=51853 RepID=UPI002FD7B06D